MPRFRHWVDDPFHPLLVIDDLSEAYWPPPWTDGRVSQALAGIDALHACKAALPAFSDIHDWAGTGWQAVAADPAPFLALGAVSPAWMEACLPALLEAEAACPTAGDAATHWDLRSDNMCFTDRAIFIDWAEACLSNPRLDIGFWLPSLAFEGGPPPEAILPGAPEIAAWVSGFFAARAGLQDIPDAPLVCRVQKNQLSTALAWVQRALKLPRLVA